MNSTWASVGAYPPASVGQIGVCRGRAHTGESYFVQQSNFVQPTVRPAMSSDATGATSRKWRRKRRGACQGLAMAIKRRSSGSSSTSNFCYQHISQTLPLGMGDGVIGLGLGWLSSRPRLRAEECFVSGMFDQALVSDPENSCSVIGRGWSVCHHAGS